jgi:hypothetical protein
MASKAEYMASFPITGVTCAGCGAENCVIYPGEAGARTTVCPNCSSSVAEELLCTAAERDGFKLGARVFPPPADPLAEYRAWEAELPDWAREDLEAAWHASADGSDCTGHFGCTEDGQVAYLDGGPKPSYALAILFDRENFAAGRDHVLPWVDDREAVAA